MGSQAVPNRARPDVHETRVNFNGQGPPLNQLFTTFRQCHWNGEPCLYVICFSRLVGLHGAFALALRFSLDAQSATGFSP